MPWHDGYIARGPFRGPGGTEHFDGEGDSADGDLQLKENARSLYGARQTSWNQT